MRYKSEFSHLSMDNKRFVVTLIPTTPLNAPVASTLLSFEQRYPMVPMSTTLVRSLIYIRSLTTH